MSDRIDFIKKTFSGKLIPWDLEHRARENDEGEPAEFSINTISLSRGCLGMMEVFERQSSTAIMCTPAQFSDYVVECLAALFDPTQKKTCTQWLVIQYRRQNIRLEDAEMMRQQLSEFEQYKSKLEKRDINQYKTAAEMWEAVQPHLGTHSSKNAQARAEKHEGALLIHEDEEVLVYRLLSVEGAIHYGKNTRWCTSTVGNTIYASYAKDGPLFVIIDRRSNEKFQIHFHSGQFMTQLDTRIPNFPTWARSFRAFREGLVEDLKTQRDAKGDQFTECLFFSSGADVEKMIPLLVKSGREAMREFAAETTNDPEHFRVLRMDKHVGVRRIVAARGDKPSLDWLTRDSDRMVINTIAIRGHDEHLDYFVKRAVNLKQFKQLKWVLIHRREKDIKMLREWESHVKSRPALTVLAGDLVESLSADPERVAETVRQGALVDHLLVLSDKFRQELIGEGIPPEADRETTRRLTQWLYSRAWENRFRR